MVVGPEVVVVAHGVVVVGGGGAVDVVVPGRVVVDVDVEVVVEVLVLVEVLEVVCPRATVVEVEVVLEVLVEHPEPGSAAASAVPPPVWARPTSASRTMTANAAICLEAQRRLTCS